MNPVAKVEIVVEVTRRCANQFIGTISESGRTYKGVATNKSDAVQAAIKKWASTIDAAGVWGKRWTNGQLLVKVGYGQGRKPCCEVCP